MHAFAEAHLSSGYPETPTLACHWVLHCVPNQLSNAISPACSGSTMGASFQQDIVKRKRKRKKKKARTTSTDSLRCELLIPDTFQISVISFFGLLPTAHDHRRGGECRLTGKLTTSFLCSDLSSLKQTGTARTTHTSVYQSPAPLSLNCQFNTRDT